MRVATISGVPVRLHWTFFVVPVLVMVSSEVAHWLPLFGLIAILALVVVAHEFGHIFAARQYGIRTKDVLLTPIGGLARMTGMPNSPGAEVKIALAGPAVNFVFALIAMPFVLLDPLTSAQAAQPTAWNFAHMFVAVNLMLGIFNLLPAFPMDGGRVLRGLLAMRMPRLQATEAAVGVGRVLAVFMAVFGLFYNPWLILIALFIWFVGGLEYRQEQVLEAHRRMRQAGGGGGELPPQLVEMLRKFGIDPTSAAAQQQWHTGQHPHSGSHAADHAASSARRAAPRGWPFGGGIPVQVTTGRNGQAATNGASENSSSSSSAASTPRTVKVEVIGARANRPIPDDEQTAEANRANHHTARNGRHYYKGQELL